MVGTKIERRIPTSKMQQYRETLRTCGAWSVQTEETVRPDVVLIKALVPKSELDRLPEYDV